MRLTPQQIVDIKYFIKEEVEKLCQKNLPQENYEKETLKRKVRILEQKIYELERCLENLKKYNIYI